MRVQEVMPVRASTPIRAITRRTVPARPSTARALLLALAGLALASGVAVLGAPAPAIDPDLARVIRCMALIKGAFALAALAGGYWRLGRPSAPWRRTVYVAAPALMIAGATGLWSLHATGPAAVALHLGLLAAVAAALTDPDFWPDRPRRGRA